MDDETHEELVETPEVVKEPETDIKEEIRLLREEIARHNQYHQTTPESVADETVDPIEPERPLEVVELDVTPVTPEAKKEYAKRKRRF